MQRTHIFVLKVRKHDFSKRHQKIGIFYTVYRLFGPNIAINISKNNIIRINSTKAFDWCMNCNIWIKKNFGQFLS